ncbi:hypothetical protein B0H13DRAFT_2298179 [Mycena leptocephala]|nr:hypothetical protein B0H13DRAFT_2298179 [Mycena leptocephala]
MSIWLRWAVDPASALRVLLLPPLLALPTHFLLPLLRPYLSLPLQGVGNPFTPFFLLSHSTAAPDRLSAAVVRPELLIPGASEAVGDTEAREGGAVWGAGVCGGLVFGGGAWGGVHPLHHPRLLHVQAPHAALLARQALPRGLLFSAYTRACIDSVLARADAGSVRAASSPAESHSLLGAGFSPDSRHVVPMHLLFLLDALRSWGIPGPEPNAAAYTKALRWALSSRTLNRM